MVVLVIKKFTIEMKKAQFFHSEHMLEIKIAPPKRHGNVPVVRHTLRNANKKLIIKEMK